MSSPFPCSPVIREYSWKKTHIEKKNIYYLEKFYLNEKLNLYYYA